MASQVNKRTFYYALMIMVSFSMMVILLLTTVKASAAQVVVSKVVKTAEGKGYLEVDGKPFLMNNIQNWGKEQILGDKLNSAPPP